MTETHTQNRRLGYARVSTYGQTLDAQLEQLRGAGCTKIYREKVTGARADRRQLLDMLKHLVPGDRVIVTRIDRFARSTFALFAIVEGRRGGPCAARASALVARPPRKALTPLASDG